MALNLVNTSVMSTDNRTLLPWSILRVTEEANTISDFYRDTVNIRINEIDSRGGEQYVLVSAYVGQERSLLDFVDVNLPIVAVVASFGPFLKYLVSSNTESERVALVTDSPQSSNTVAAPSQFVSLVNVRTEKDKLFNDIIGFFVSASASFYDSEIAMGKRFIILLRDIFWYLDGHHHVFEARAQSIPPIFQFLTNYNVPELSSTVKG